ncbi:MAG: UDP-N-acetylmuramoyl-tripeptide--D-alanyl-D-alanine ligase, partial [Planctomycetota bacterium]
MSFFDAETLRSVTAGRWLQRPADGVEFDGVGIDTREVLRGRIFFAIRGERHDGHDFLPKAVEQGALLLVVGRAPDPLPPEPVGVLLVDDPRRALGRVAKAYRRTLGGTRVVAITGSVGKTTTKNLIDAVLGSTLRGRTAPRSYNNDIGVPLTVLGAQPTDQYLLAEIGTSGPGEIGRLGQICEPEVAVLTMAGRGHLEGLGSVDAVAREKLSLAACLRPGGLAVVNADSPPLRGALKTTRNVVLYGEAPDANLRLTDRGAEGDHWWFEINHRHRYPLMLPGRHNAVNAVAAVAVGRRFGLDDETIAEGLRSAEAPPMRLSRPSSGRCLIFNDAYNANPESMDAALDTFLELSTDA